MKLLLQLLVNGIALGAVYGFISVGYSLVFGVLKVFNIAHGEIAVGAAYVGLLVARSESNILVVAPVVVLAGCVIGAVVDRVCIRPVARGPWSAALLTTLGASMVIAGILRWRFGTDTSPMPLSIGSGTIEVFGLGISKTYLTVIVLALVLTVVLEVILTRTSLGRWLRAIAEDPENAALLGIRVPLVRLGTVTVSSGLGAGAGLLLSIMLAGLNPAMGLQLSIKGVIVLIVGGLNSPKGAMVIGVGLGVAEVLTAAYVSSSFRDLVAYGVLLAVLILRPAGLFGRAGQLAGVRP